MTNTPARKMRNRVFKPYLDQTGRAKVVPSDFMAWLVDHPESEAYLFFFGDD